MKSKLKSLMCLASVFMLCSCSNNDYLNKDLNKMSLIELNRYNDYLNEENDRLKDE